MQSFKKYYPDEFKKLKHAGKISSQCLDLVEEKIKPGITTEEIDKICNDFLKKNRLADNVCCGWSVVSH